MPKRTRPGLAALIVIVLIQFANIISAHPLGNLTINHFTRIESGQERVNIRYVIDFAEIPAFQELQAADTDSSGSLSEKESQAWLDRLAAELPALLKLTADGQPVTLLVTSKNLTLAPGAAGLQTIRIECNLEGSLPVSSVIHRFHFEDTSHAQRQGWHEMIVTPAAGISVFDSTAFGSGITDELKAYPEDMLMAPLNERTAEWSATTGAIPAGAKLLMTRTGKPVVKARDRLAELISAQSLAPGVAILALLLAFVLGGAHALTPGHGKAVVGAYLVGSRGTAKHAAFLGLTVTITHTATVYGVLLVTLFASHYLAPEKIFPILGFVSGLIVLVMGLSMFARRLNATLGASGDQHSHHPDHAHPDHAHPHEHSPDESLTHSHDGQPHTHLPPEQITWRSLLALGASGGMLPCPSAMVVALSAIGLNRVAFGFLLILAFSLGLAGVLTAIGLAFVYAGKFINQRMDNHSGLRIVIRVLPVLSALFISILGGILCYEALQQAGVNFQTLLRAEEPTGSLTTISVLTLGLILGLKHAIEADHIAAVTTIVSERKSLLSSALVGGMWGIGHTIPILLVGLAVILLRFEIKERVGLSLEFCVGLMLIGLGAQALWKLLRGDKLHLHAHQHGGHVHLHPHFHDHETGELTHDPQLHHPSGPGWRPLFVGMMHGLAGSAALVPLVVAEIRSPLVGMFYMLVFGLGSVGGMMLMSSLVGVPLQLTAARFARFNFALRAIAGLFSVGFGLFMVYEIGFAKGLLW